MAVRRINKFRTPLGVHSEKPQCEPTREHKGLKCIDAVDVSVAWLQSLERNRTNPIFPRSWIWPSQSKRKLGVIARPSDVDELTFRDSVVHAVTPSTAVRQNGGTSAQAPVRRLVRSIVRGTPVNVLQSA